MHRRSVVWIAGFLTVAGIVCGLWFFGNREPGEGPASESRTVLPTHAIVRGSPFRENFVGNRACSRCHAEIAAHYQRSPMSRSWTAAASGIPADVSHTGTVSDNQNLYKYRVRVADGTLVQEETLRGATTHRLIGRAGHFVGSGNHARAMVAETNGYLSQLPLGWFSHEGKWKLNPGYELTNRRFGRPVLPGCLACHGGYARHKSPTPNRYRVPVTSGISCEHCHGPGRRHVDFRERTTNAARSRDPIVNPRKLPSRLANDVCLQCHLQGDIVVYRAGADAFSFRPGEKLADHRLDFLIQTKQPQAFGVASHGSRMMRSRCYTASGGKLTCIHCHDPHRPASDFSTTMYDRKCASCHTPQSCKRKLAKAEILDARGCVRCHMPRRKTREGQHLVFTDHCIRRPPKQGDVEAVPPLLQPNSDVTLVGAWPKADPERSALGIAYIQLHMSMGPQQPALDRGIAILEKALASSPNDRQSRFWLASGQIARYRGESAIRNLRQLLQERPDWHLARFRLAVAFHQSKRYQQAIAEYERVIREVPDWMEPYPLLVRLQLSRRDTKAARRLLKQQLSYRDDATAYLNLALTNHLDGKPMRECLVPIEASLHLNPRNVTAYLTRAYLFVTSDRKTDARRDYETALKIDPGNREAQAGLRAIGTGN